MFLTYFRFMSFLLFNLVFIYNSSITLHKASHLLSTRPDGHKADEGHGYHHIFPVREKIFALSRFFICSSFTIQKT